MRVALTERVYYSSTHLQGAAHLACTVRERESALQKRVDGGGASISRDERSEVWSLASAAIVSSSAAIEAAVNEFYCDAQDQARQRPHRENVLYRAISPEVAASLSLIWQAERKLDPLLKYQMALTLAGQDRFDPGTSIPWRNADALFSLRNELTHYKPAWLLEDTKLGRELRHLFPPSSLASKTSPFIPYGALGESGAAWALRTAVEFIDEFFSRVKLPSPFDAVRPMLLAAAQKQPLRG